MYSKQFTKDFSNIRSGKTTYGVIGVGSHVPAFDFCITPFWWGLEFGASKWHAGLRIGPVAIAVRWRPKVSVCVEGWVNE